MSFWSELQQVGVRRGFVDCGGARTRVVGAGRETSPAGRLIVVLHGVQGRIETWLRHVPGPAEETARWEAVVKASGARVD